jgi:hypothetical protein
VTQSVPGSEALQWVLLDISIAPPAKPGITSVQKVARQARGPLTY